LRSSPFSGAACAISIGVVNDAVVSARAGRLADCQATIAVEASRAI
jgi:hypothetical protein